MTELVKRKELRITMGRRLSVSQFVVFAALGGIGTAAHYAVLAALVQLMGVAVVPASLTGYAVGAGINLMLVHRIAFRSTARIRDTAPRFFTVALLGFVLNWLLMWLLVEQMRIYYLFSQVVATSAILFLNYVINAFWTFGGQRREF
jgi:putative flippase GtrA